MEQPSATDEPSHQPVWTVAFEADADEAPPSRFVEVHVTHQLEVVDAEVLKAAVESLDGPPADDLARRLREIPATLVGRLVGSAPLPDLPGVLQRGSAVSVGDYEPDSRQ